MDTTPDTTPEPDDTPSTEPIPVDTVTEAFAAPAADTTAAAEPAPVAASVAGDMAPFMELLDVVTHPYDARPEQPEFAQPAPLDGPPHRTFCGT